MGWLEIAATVLKILFTWYAEKREKDRVRKKNLADAKAELKRGLATRSTSEVFNGWDKVRRNRR